MTAWEMANDPDFMFVLMMAGHGGVNLAIKSGYPAGVVALLVENLIRVGLAEYVSMTVVPTMFGTKVIRTCLSFETASGKVVTRA
jgi:hypothetical protein